ncbi:hypothetical protein Q2T42_25750 [Leptolyngbya boryana CZ1]|uniref:Uncharacterized protein n=1 Tax=Leptolyngbya boryana CZ1 TaxID=3060204 RepID=A0AA96WSY6_LEPBY|nr:hypothetical protein [Leptolyngbya boryana]WNZ45195.1 hypothetical protein Q2T42_25750 [Leptolyngbya boryana CZ1]
MLAIEMPRKDTKLRLDERILDALRAQATESDISFNGLCESILFSYAKSIGKIPFDAEPLPDTRGGKRPGAGKKPRQIEESDQQSTDIE